MCQGEHQFHRSLRSSDTERQRGGWTRSAKDLRVCVLFLEQNGEILCTIVVLQRTSQDLPQGGLELLCMLTFSGDSSAVSKVETFQLPEKSICDQRKSPRA